MVGLPFELRWLQELGIDASRVLGYQPSLTYCSYNLLYPMPTPRVTPPKELLLSVRNAMQTTIVERRNLLVYVSRQMASSRRVLNEEALLTQIQETYPNVPLVILFGNESIAESKCPNEQGVCGCVMTICLTKCTF